MSNPNLPFALAEYDIRLGKVRAAMEVAGCDVLVVTDPASMAWLTGYDGWSFYVHQAVIIGLSGAPLWWGRAMDALGAKRTIYMTADNIFGYEDTFVQNPDKHPMEDLAQLVKAQGWAGSRIGLEMDNYYFTAAAYMSLVQELPDAKWVNANVLVNWQRAVKSGAEITYMRRAAKIVEKMHTTILERAEPGMKKNELIADIYHAAITGADGHWGDYPSIVPLAPSGRDATAPHLTWDDSALQKGEATFFEIAGVYRRYHAPQSRTLFLGEPPAKYRKAEAAVLEAVAAGMAQAKPGNFAEDIANAFNATLNKLGFEKDSRCGYPIGLSYPPDWGEHTYSLRRDDRTILEPGMTFHFMPALWLDDGGIEITEPVLITQTGAENLCSTPRGLVVKGYMMRESSVTPTIDLNANGVHHGYLRLPHSRNDSAWGSVMIPITVAKNGDGPTALLTGANHGDEYEGPLALLELSANIKAKELTGRVIIIPFMNMPAFVAGTRTSPIDGGNMNRTFPGRPDGTVTEKIADYFQRYLLPIADFVLDFHSGGKTLDFLPYAASHLLDDKEQEARCCAARDAFNAPYSMQMLEIDSAGMYDDAAEDMGKTFVTTELGGGGTSCVESVDVARKGVRNMLIHAGIFHGEMEIAPTRHLSQTDTDCFHFAETRGVVEFTVGLGDPIKKGDVLAKIWELRRIGHAPMEIRAKMDGLLAVRHTRGLVQLGDCLAVLAQEEKQREIKC